MFDLPDGVHTKRYMVQPETKLMLERWDPSDSSGFGGEEARAVGLSKKLDEKLDLLQAKLFAEHKHMVLVVLQAMDTGGKDGTIRRIFRGVNPSGVRVAHFREPTQLELDHDFLWRAHAQVPAKGELVIFNRSHYEGVLVERVHGLVTKDVWRQRYRQINDFEERRLWPKYMKAYQQALEATTTDFAPWYIVPSNKKWFRDLLVSAVIVDALEGLHMEYPPVTVDLKSVKLR